MNYLCERINQCPKATLMNKHVWYRIVMLRQKAFKDKESGRELHEVCMVIQCDGRKRKRKELLTDHDSHATFEQILERRE